MVEDTISACGGGICSWGTNPDPSIKTVVGYTWQNGANYAYYTKNNLIVELLSNNSNEKFNYATSNSITIKCYSAAYNGYGYEAYSGYNSRQITQFANKSLNIFSESITSSYRYSSRNYYTTVTAEFNSCFRPAFHYKDNNKSQNIFR